MSSIPGIVGYKYPMFIEPTITWVPSGFSGYIWLDTKIVLKKKVTQNLYVGQYVVYFLEGISTDRRRSVYRRSGYSKLSCREQKHKASFSILMLSFSKLALLSFSKISACFLCLKLSFQSNISKLYLIIIIIKPLVLRAKPSAREAIQMHGKGAA